MSARSWVRCLVAFPDSTGNKFVVELAAGAVSRWAAGAASVAV